jgi:hypothetical protein
LPLRYVVGSSHLSVAGVLVLSDIDNESTMIAIEMQRFKENAR